MRKIYNLLACLLSLFRPREAAADPLAALAPRDWADLPTYHPWKG